MKNNSYQRAEYLLSAHSLSQLPVDSGSEVAFAGRSNVGKSSVINALIGRKNLARTSKTPGRTRQIIFFSLDNDLRIVDLPGYGYARVPGSLKQHWSKLVSSYFNQRKSLKGLVLITDSRHELTEYDEQMLGWSRSVGLPVHIVLNKADKLSKSAAIQALNGVTQQMADQSTSVQLFSVLQKTGVEELRTQLSYWLSH